MEQEIQIAAINLLQLTVKPRLGRNDLRLRNLDDYNSPS